MITYHVETAQLDQAKDHFADRLQAQDLLASAQKSNHSPRANPARLWAYADGSLPWPQTDLETQLRTSLPLRRAFRHMVENATPYHLPQARAASSDILPQREGRNCRLSMEPSRAEPNQLYLIVELQDVGHDGPVQLTLCNHEQAFIRVDLPTPRNGIAQVILDRSSDIVQWLTDPRTEAFVK